MAVRYFALTYGVVFLLVGAAGFVPALVEPYDASHPELLLHSSEGLLFGLFPVNLLHNLTHLAFGVWGILAWRNAGAARRYAKVVALVYALFVLMGLIPGLKTVFGLVPLHGHDVWLHLLLAGVAGYFSSTHRGTGYSAPATQSEGYATVDSGSTYIRAPGEPSPPLTSTSQGTGAATLAASGGRSADAPYGADNGDQGDSHYASGNSSGQQTAAPTSTGGMLETDSGGASSSGNTDKSGGTGRG